MKKLNWICVLTFTSISLFIIAGCEKEKTTTLPVLNTTSVTNITDTNALSGGNITNNGYAEIIEQGICWSITDNPTINDIKTTGDNGSSAFSCKMNNLIANTTYYVRAYATNIAGTSYGNSVSFKTKQTENNVVTDIDGNIYHTITIGTQIWMAENLKTTKYNDGTLIPLVTDTWNNLTTPGFCWYNNDEATYKSTYGAMYNWYTVNTGKLCPTGWHVPTDSEWTILSSYLGGESVAAGKMKETGTTHWNSPNTGASNSSGFTALPGGRRNPNGSFFGIGLLGSWWSSTEGDATNTWILYINANNAGIGRFNDPKQSAFSVRCIKD